MGCHYSPLKGTDWSTLFKNWNRSYFEKRESRSGWKVWQISKPLEMLIGSLYNIGWLKINDTRMGESCVHKNNKTGNVRGDDDKSLARPGRKQATATEDFDFHISYL